MLIGLSSIASAIESEQALSAWQICERGTHYIAITNDDIVLVLAAAELWSKPKAIAAHWVRARSGNYTLLLIGNDEELEAGALAAIGDDAAAAALITVPISCPRLALTLRGIHRVHKSRRDLAKCELALERSRFECDLLIDVGRALSSERDMTQLLHKILAKAREVTGADAGSVYIVDGDLDDPCSAKIRFIASQNDSRDIESDGHAMEVSESSIVGACVLSAEVINVPDLYKLDTPGSGNNRWRFVHNRSWDQRVGYQTRSMVTVPMISARDQVIGVIQLINKRARGVAALDDPDCFDDSVLPFDEISINYAKTLASQAGIALENALLYNEVETLFEGFVHASVSAIESRDPTTSGHSERVAQLTVGLATAADRADGPFRSIAFDADTLREIKYAALLHDFGKVGVREHVLVKAKKLYPLEQELLEARFHYIHKSIEAEGHSAMIGSLLAASREEMEAAATHGLPVIFRDKLEEIDSFVEFILKANEPTVLEQGGFEKIAEIAARTYRDHHGANKPYLTECEVIALQVARGSLTADERKEIESHVVHSYHFLKQIPWARNLRNVPDIAGAHHEKLDGSGYPHGLVASEIPLPTKMMTIADIFDALTASDRPYKRAVPTPIALDILGKEVSAGKLDDDLYQLFVESKIWSKVV